MDSYYLVADIGGTKSELAVYVQKDDVRSYFLKKRFVTGEYKSLEDLIAHFLQERALKIEAAVLAIAGPIPHLRKEDLHTINKGVEKEHETMAVIAPGTGLGEAFLVWDGTQYKPCISEGAHVNFGPGIPSIYEYLLAKSVKNEDSAITKKLADAEDLTRTLITMAFLDSFFDKGVMAEMMPDVPIHIITNPDTAILGAAEYLFNES